MEDIREELLEILEKIKPEVDFETETELVDGEILDSFDIVAILSKINEAFDCRILAGDILPDNLNSLDAMVALIQKARKEDN